MQAKLTNFVYKVQSKVRLLLGPPIMLKEILASLKHEHLIIMRGYLGPKEEWGRRYEGMFTGDEVRQIREQLDPKIDSCEMDTALRLFPERLHAL